MATTHQDVLSKIRAIVDEHYSQVSAPLLLSALGTRLRQQHLWPTADAARLSLREFIEKSGESQLTIVRDKQSPAYIAVATPEYEPIVEQWIARRVKAVASVPDLDALPRPVILAFCVQTEPGQTVYVRKSAPFRYELSVPEGSESDDFIPVDERYRRPGLRFAEPNDLQSSDRLDLQTRIAAWSRDKNIPIETFYRMLPKKHANALERLISAQPPGVAERIVIPGDIAILLTKHD